MDKNVSSLKAYKLGPSLAHPLTTARALRTFLRQWSLPSRKSGKLPHG
jgi:hypothetical protein